MKKSILLLSSLVLLSGVNFAHAEGEDKSERARHEEAKKDLERAAKKCDVKIEFDRPYPQLLLILPDAPKKLEEARAKKDIECLNRDLAWGHVEELEAPHKEKGKDGASHIHHRAIAKEDKK